MDLGYFGYHTTIQTRKDECTEHVMANKINFGHVHGEKYSASRQCNGNSVQTAR